MNQSLLEILLVFFSIQSRDNRMTELCEHSIGINMCLGVGCSTCLLGRRYGKDTNIYKRLNQIETTLKVITNEPTTDNNNK